METIDIIIPAYNCSDFLDNCLDSLVKQTYTAWKAILINDGSTDGKTEDLCNAWKKKDSRIEVIHFSTNKGVSAARNEGLKHAHSPFLTFLDSDDSLAPNHLESLMKSLTQSGASIAMCGMTRCHHNGRHECKRSLLPKGTILMQSDLYALTVMDKILSSHLWNKLYRRELFSGIVFPEGKTYEDFAIMLEVMSRVNQLVHTGEASYFYRQTSSGITHTSSLKNLQDFFLAAALRIEQIKAVPFLSAEVKNRLLVWPIKRMFKLYHTIRKAPEGEERDRVLEQLTNTLLQCNIPIATGAFRYQNICYSIQKRLFERAFFRQLRQKIKGTSTLS